MSPDAVHFNFVYPPIPIRDFDWSAVRDSYDEGSPHGSGVNKEAAAINLFLDEETTLGDTYHLIEGPAHHYLGARKLGCHEFYWTTDHDKALAFRNLEQADGALMAIRELRPDLFPSTFGEVRAVEHMWNHA